MPFASTDALRRADFEREPVLPSMLGITRFPYGPQSLGADEEPFATSAQQHQAVPARYRIRHSFPGPRHSPLGARDRVQAAAVHAQKRFARWPNLPLLGWQLRE